VIRLLAAGIDSLYWSARCELSAFPALLAAKETAAQRGEDAMPWVSVDGFSLSVLPRGKTGYPVALQCDEFRMYITDSRSRPTIYTQLRSSFLHSTGGVAAALEQSLRVAETIMSAALGQPHPSRVDLYADFAGWRLVQDDRRGVVTHAKVHLYARAGTEELETLQVGKSPLLLRLYRKDIEVAHRGGHAPVFWNGWTGPVTRVEAQVSSARLRDFQFSDCRELLNSTGDVWRYATNDFLQLREPGPGPRETWRVRPEWLLVQETGMREFPASGLVPFKVVKGRRDKVVAQLLGYLASYAAFDGIEEPRAVVEGLLAEFPDLVLPTRARTFAVEVLRRRALLPRAVRRLPRGLLPAGKDEHDRRTNLNNTNATNPVGGDA
jgi:hypothetical protein